MQGDQDLHREELKKIIIDKIGEKAFYKIEKIYEKVMGMFGVKKEMPFQIKFAFGLHNKIRKKGGGGGRICWHSGKGSIPVILLQ